MKKTTTETIKLSLKDVREILLNNLSLPSNCKFKFKVSQKPDPKADVRDPSFITQVVAVEAKWTEGEIKSSLKIPIAKVSDIICLSNNVKNAQVNYQTKQVQDKTADVRDYNWYTVVSGVVIRSAK